MYSKVEYIWLDGTKPTQQIRSKTKILDICPNDAQLKHFPQWSFDGSSTYQSSGDNSDLKLNPVLHCKDPIRGEGNYLVLCEVLLANNQPHASNTRHKLQDILKVSHAEFEPWVGFEQEYTLFYGRSPLGWPKNGFPEPQGPFYCGIGNNRVHGREIVEEHSDACLQANLALFGTNAEVMPGQWEFQLGYRGFKNENLDSLTYSDHLWLARYLLCRIAEDHKVSVSFDNKPVKGDWNGAGCHTNFSTKQMRASNSGLKSIQDAIEILATKHKDHISVYGEGLNERLTGLHETCSINKFCSGIANRGASIRIPQQVADNKCGYLEDRRPGANCDPYLVTSRLITSICGLDEAWFYSLKKAA